jgi:SnoaL-like domain
MTSHDRLAAYGHLAAYSEGWINGDVDTVLPALADDYVLDDPHFGRIAKDGMPGYFEQLKAAVRELRGGAEESPVMRIGEVTTREEGDRLVVWLWWAVPGTALEGAGLIKIGRTGVTSERLAYFTKLAI